MMKSIQWVIAPGYVAKKHTAFRAWGKFNLDELPPSLKLRVGAESFYALWLNGKQLGNGPARGTHALCYIDEYEISSYVKKGENVVAVLVYSSDVESFVVAPSGEPALALEIEQMLTSTQMHGAPAEDFLYTTEPYTYPIGVMESRDLRLEPGEEWLKGKGEAADWPGMQPSTNERLLAKTVLPRNIPFLERKSLAPQELSCRCEVELSEKKEEEPIGKWLDSLRRKTLSEGERCQFPIKPGIQRSGVGYQLIFDFALDRTGYPELVFEHAKGGEVVLVSVAEDMANGQIHTSYGSSPQMLFTDRYVLKQGKNHLGSKLNGRGGRFLQIVILDASDSLELTSVTWEDQRYPRPHRATFNCNDDFLNWLWNACEETMSLCMEDIFVDCPWRERAFWLNDLVVENSISLELYGASEIHRRAFELAFSEQRPEGWLNGMCPAPNENSLRFVITPVSLYIFHVMEMYYLYSGDKETVRQYLPCLKKILAAVEATRDDKGIVSAPNGAWNFYDWAFEFADICFRDSKESMFNCLYVTALNLFLKLARECHVPVDEAYYMDCRERVKEALWKNFPIINGRIMNPCTFYEPQFQPEGAVHPPVAVQLAHALALEAETVPAEQLKNFLDAIEDPTCAISDYYLHYYLLRALATGGRTQQALNRIRKYWGPLQATGEKTIFEIGIIGFGKAAAWNSASLCHGFATAPVDFMQRCLLGIRPVKAGFIEFMVDIHPCDLHNAEGTVPTPYGSIEISWQRVDDGRLSVKLNVPPETQALLPDGRRFCPGQHLFDWSPAKA